MYFSTNTDPIQIKKEVNKILRQSQTISKPTNCILCDEKQTSFCNSHSVPQMFLRNIADKGKILHANALIGMEVIDLEKGVNNSGTFHFICNRCDSTYFRDYECLDNIIKIPTNRMLAEIALKNSLLMLSKRKQESVLYQLLQNEYHPFVNWTEMENIHTVDIKDFSDEVDFYKQIIDNNTESRFQILFWKKLSFKVPIAAQSLIALTKDMYGNPINDIYDMSPNVSMQYMHLCIFPLENESIIFAFYNKKDRAYRQLRHQFNSESESTCLKYLNYLIFAYTENYFISKKMEDVIKDTKLIQLSQEKDGSPNLGFSSFREHFSEYVPITMDEIPNFLSAEYAIH